MDEKNNICEKVYRVCRYFLQNHDYLLNNVYMFNWESDLFAISTSGYVVEIEVKISRSDFFADFKKAKHALFNTFQDKPDKPNKFYFACPEGLIKPYEVPAYAGLIYVHNEGYVSYTVVKTAPFIHKVKLDLESKLLSKYYNAHNMARNMLMLVEYNMKTKKTTLDKELKDILKVLK